MKYLIEQATNFLAITFAVLFSITVVYCMVYFDSISYGLRSYLAFSDVINISVRLSPAPLIFTMWMFWSYFLVSPILAPRSKSWAWLNWAMQIVITLSLFYLFYRIYITSYYEEFGDLIIPSVLGAWVAIGFVISAVTAAVIQSIALGWDSSKFILLLLLPPLVLAIVVMTAAFDARRVIECKRPFEAIYTLGASDEPVPQQVCPIMPLQYGLLVYEKEASATRFVPWSELRVLVRHEQHLLSK